MTRPTALALTVLTGFSGLVYQIAWQKYLGTLLGSHSEATAAVLAIFLGGLSAGYALFGRVTSRLTARAAERGRAAPLLVVYGVLEIAIGVWAVAFPVLFEAVRTLSYALPYGADAVGFAIDVALAVLLLGPPTVLMGGTIPILTQALSRSVEEATRFHALVYACNTVGAFGGALAGGFSLVPTLGLARVMLAMGAINAFAGTLFLLLAWLGRAPGARSPNGPDAPAPAGLGTYAAIAALVGFAMMVVQTSVIRVAGLSFGPSQFSFAMVVAIFVLCIALGSFAVSAVPAVRSRHVVVNQWALAGLAVVLYLALGRAPYLAYVLRTLLQDSEPAFYLHQLHVFLLLGLLVGPAVVCSGAVLPLLFHQLRREIGELGHVAGALYSWNTVGSLLGALLGGYLLLVWLDLHQVYRLALAALVLAALLLTIRTYAMSRWAALAAVPLLAVPGLLASWDPALMSVGLFRERAVWPNAYAGADAFLEGYVPYREPLVHFEDDPTTTVSVWVSDVAGRESLTLKTNGKPDGNTIGDYPTMAMLGLVPALFVDDPRHAFVIGYGTGVTAGELASLDAIETVTVSEISSGVIRAAPLFDPTNRAASRNGKIRVVRGDAYRTLMRSEGAFDVIVSEPSNPWVGGVETLYSREFLAAARERLTPGGVFAQWFQLYEVDEPTLEIVLRTYASVFEHVSAWYMVGSDLLLLGFDSPGSARDHFRLEQQAARPDFRAGLRRAGVESFPALLAHELLPLGVVHALDLPGPLQTLAHPRLGYLAGRAFFGRRNMDPPFSGGGRAAEIGRRNSLLNLYARRFGGTLPDEQRAQVVRQTCRHKPSLCATLLAAWRREAPGSAAYQQLAGQLAGVAAPEDVGEIVPLFESTTPNGEPVTVTEAERVQSRFETHYHHAAPFDGRSLIDTWSRCRARPPTPEECAEAFRTFRERAPLDAEDSAAEWIDRCRTETRVGRACHRGLEKARALVGGNS